MTTRQQVAEEPADETLISQITIQPDGRVYVFGASRQVLEVLEAVNPIDRRVGLLLQRVRDTREKR
jgi:hypothetical protein